jgi:hypothetical protein
MAMLQDNRAAPGGTEGGWDEPRATALLVLADGTVLEGFGIGADGRARGRGLLQHRDDGLPGDPHRPSYAGQIITFTFPHIGNVGTNEEDTESLNAAGASGVRGLVLAAPDHRPGELARQPPPRRVAEGPGHRRHHGRGHPGADRADPRPRHAERRDRHDPEGSSTWRA